MSRRRPPRFTVFRFYVRLHGFEPAIWRVICVADCLLDNLFQSLLVSLGWRSERALRCTALESPCPSLDGLDAYDWPFLWLSQVLAEDDAELRLRCELGRDDPWRFEIIFQGCATSTVGASYPLCLAGERAGVPDDGIRPREFRTGLAAAAQPDHHHRAVAVGGGGSGDRATFDLEEVNSELRRLCKRQNPIDEDERAFRVRVSAAERELFFEHARVHGLAFPWLRDRQPSSVLRVYGPDAGAAARSLALAANRVDPGKPRRRLERLAGRFYRCAVEHQERLKTSRAEQLPQFAAVEARCGGGEVRR